jgi:hypothetical protein
MTNKPSLQMILKGMLNIEEEGKHKPENMGKNKSH